MDADGTMPPLTPVTVIRAKASMDQVWELLMDNRQAVAAIACDALDDAAMPRLMVLMLTIVSGELSMRVLDRANEAGDEAGDVHETGHPGR